MKVKEITYSRLFGIDGYENEKIGVTFGLDEGDDVKFVMQSAVDFVNREHEKRDLERKKVIIEREEKEKERQRQWALDHPEYKEVPF